MGAPSFAMKLKFVLSLAVLGLGLLQPVAAAPALIPKPQVLEEKEGTFTWTPGAGIEAPREAAAQAGLLRECFGPLVGAEARNGAIIFRRDEALAEEEYDVAITPQGIVLAAAGPVGWAHGVATLRQLAPPERLGTPNDATPVVLPCLHLHDAPRFAWRGLMLDVTVRFSTKEEVEKFIDLLSLYKMNVFHWHLTDDPGWRLEIKKYPKLTELGAWRMEKGERYGGFYTQDDARAVVAYAAARGVTVVPEIDMPSHAEAIVASYPEYSTKGGEPRTMVGQDRTDVLSPAKEETYAFIDDVLGEVADIFPSTYLHIGGDELDLKYWNDSAECQAFMKSHHLANAEGLRNYFMRRVQKIVEAKGRKMAAWQEALYGGPLPGVLIMGWRYYGGVGLDDAQTNPVVETPQNPLYFDFPYTQNTVEKVYQYHPLTNDPLTKNLTSTQVKNVLGIQANMWSWIAHSTPELQGYIFPRLCSLAEVAWIDPQAADLPDFLERAKTALKQMEALGVACDKLGVEQILDPEAARKKEAGDGSIPPPGRK